MWLFSRRQHTRVVWLIIHGPHIIPTHSSFVLGLVGRSGEFER